jgi:hypothetical protein
MKRAILTEPGYEFATLGSQARRNRDVRTEGNVDEGIEEDGNSLVVGGCMGRSGDSGAKQT